MKGLIKPFDYTSSIAELLKAAGMTQAQLAENLGLTQGRISHLLRNPKEEMKYESRYLLHELCTEYKVAMPPKQTEETEGA